MPLKQLLLPRTSFLNVYLATHLTSTRWMPYDALYPVVCFDERPCFLIGEEVVPLDARPGQVAKAHYAYTKDGSVPGEHKACIIRPVDLGH